MSLYSIAGHSLPIALSIDQGYITTQNTLTQEKVRIQTLSWLCAKIRNIIAFVLPCCFLGSAEINVQNRVYYVARSDIKNQLAYTKNDVCDSQDPLLNAMHLQTIALQYFEKNENLLPPSPLPSTSQPMQLDIVQETHSVAAVVPSNDPSAFVNTFLALKERIKKSSGYHLHLTGNSNEWLLKIVAVGEDDQDIVPPPLSTIKQCTCCNTCYEHTLLYEPRALSNSLSQHIEHEDMFAVFSRTGNLLLIPDTRKPHIRVEDFPHLFHLHREQLHKVFSAILQADAWMRTRFPSSYHTNIGCHIGRKGNQTVRVLHIRMENLPPEIRNLS